MNLRVRPLDSARKTSVVTTSDDGTSVTINAPKSSAAYKAGDRSDTFHFSQVFGPTSSQSEIYEKIALPIVSGLIAQDCHALIFSYGVTNSGKSYTIHGTEQDPGVLPRALRTVFNSIKKTGSENDRFPIGNSLLLPTRL